MARKVFISFLGTNNYLDTHYELGGRQSSLVRFIQEALLELAFNDWTADDHIYIFGTDGDEGSYKKNWLDNGQSDKNGPIIQPGLKTQLTNMGLKTPFDFEFIPEGFSSDDVWKMMEIITGKLEQGDEIHLDVTHAFRSIPMLATTLFNYTQFMLGTTLASVHYGAFEKLGPRYKVEKIPEEDRIAPIIDMTDIVRLQDFTDAASSLTEFGRIKKIGEHLSNQSSFGKKIQGWLKEIKIQISRLDDYITTCRLADIRKGKYMSEITHYSQMVKCNANTPGMVVMMLDKLLQELEQFKPCECDANIEAAIGWTRKYDMLPQSYTLAREYVLYCIANQFAEHKPAGYDEKDFREYISGILSISDQDIEADNIKGNLSTHIELTRQLLNNSTIRRLRKPYWDLGDARNTINHAKGDVKADKLRKRLVSYDQCIEIIKEESNHGSKED